MQQVNNVIAARAAGRGALCAQDFALINSWRWDPNITVAVEQFLTVAGWNEMVAVAQRYRNAFPTLLPTAYNRNWFTFRHTDRQRTQATVRAFADGLFGHNGYRQVYVEPVANPDNLLRPHDGCPLYDAVSDNTVQRALWQNGNEFQTMMNQVGFIFLAVYFSVSEISSFILFR